MIQSVAVQLAPDENGRVFLILDTVIDHKHVFTACGGGRVDRGEPRLTAIGQGTLQALGDYAESDGMQALRLVEVATAQATRTRVLKALEAADEKDAVFFICRSSEIIDAVLREIGIDVNARGEFHVQ